MRLSSEWRGRTPRALCFNMHILCVFGGGFPAPEGQRGDVTVCFSEVLAMDFRQLDRTQLPAMVSVCRMN